MKKFLIGTLSFCLILLTGGSLLIMHNVNRTILVLPQTLTQMQQAIQDTRAEIHGNSQNLAAVLIQLGLTADQARLASMEQRKYWAQNSRETHKVLVSLNATVLAVKTSLSTLTDGAANELSDLDQATKNLNQVALSLNIASKQAGDTLEKLDQPLTLVTLNLAQTSQHLNQISADVSAEIHKFVYPPPRKWYQKYILDPARFGLKMVTIPLR